MRYRWKTTVMGMLALACVSSLAFAQAPAPAPAGQAPAAAPGQAAPAAVGSAVDNPSYVTMVMDIDVNKPAAEVWKRVGKYCDIGEWLRVACTMAMGKDNEVGSVRSVANEILVAKTELSYTYTQPVRNGRPYNMYHGTIEARPVTATTSKLIYTLMWDNSMLPDDAAKDRDKQQRQTMFTGALQNMKILAEGGTLPPAPPRGAGAPGAPGAGAPGAGAPAGRGRAN